MTKFFQFCFFLLLGFMLYSCSGQPAELKTAEKLIETAPDSALHILRHLSPDKYKADKNRALYGLLMIQALDRKHLPLKPDSLLDFSIDYYQNNKDGNRLATSYLFKGRTCKYASQYEKAITFYLKALDETNESNNNLLLGRINLDMGDINNIQGDYKVAREKYQKAYQYFKEAKFQPQAFYSLLNIGRTYYQAKDYKTAQAYYRKIESETNDSVQVGELFQEMGLSFYKSNNIDSALHYFKKSLDYPYIGINHALCYSNLADLYFSVKQYDSAFYFAKNAFCFEIGFRTQRDCYRIMTNCEFIKGNTQNVTIYMNKYVALGDSLRKVEAQAKGSYMETTHVAKKEAVKNKYIAWHLGVLAILTLIAAYFLYRFITRRSRVEKQQLQQTHRGEKVTIHKKVIEDKRVNLLQQIEERKKQLLPEFKNSGPEKREKELRNIYKELLHYDDPELFYKEMDKLLNGVVTILKNRYSILNENELMLCCYLLLHIPTYDMLILFGYKSNVGLKSLKGRLSKKLQLKNAGHITEFLLTLLVENQ